MKKLLTTVVISATLAFISCESATFDTPQPHNIKSSNTFKQQLIGKYIAGDKESIVLITDQLITRHYNYEVKEHKDSLSLSYKLIGNRLINQDIGKEEPVVVEGDSLIRRVNFIDTLFNISNGNILKEYKGYYFLNNQYKNVGWQVKKLSLKEGVLTIGRISNDEDIQKLKKITQTASDTIRHFSLTKQQFKKFLKQDGFSGQETFFRIKDNSR